MDRLREDEITSWLERSPWERDGDEVVLDREFGDFAGAIAFVNGVAEAAEAAGHHPDIAVHGWNKVRLRLTTHSAGGLTAADVALSREVDRL